jgi:hypothetical protein
MERFTPLHPQELKKLIYLYKNCMLVYNFAMSIGYHITGKYIKQMNSNNCSVYEDTQKVHCPQTVILTHQVGLD